MGNAKPCDKPLNSGQVTSSIGRFDSDYSPPERASIALAISARTQSSFWKAIVNRSAIVSEGNCGRTLGSGTTFEATPEAPVREHGPSSSFPSPSTLTRTWVMPAWMYPSCWAAARLRSMIRPLCTGPRSLTRTTTDLPLFRFSTLTRVPNGKVRWAAAICPGAEYSPLAVFPRRSYQDALPHSVAASDRSFAVTSNAVVARTPNVAVADRIWSLM